ncbi:unnamed protein product, partial [Brassica rapa subsp. trilocularis]
VLIFFSYWEIPELISRFIIFGISHLHNLGLTWIYRLSSCFIVFKPTRFIN